MKNYFLIVLFVTLSSCGQNNEKQLQEEQETSASLLLQFNEFRKIVAVSKDNFKNDFLKKYEVIKRKSLDQPEQYSKPKGFAEKIVVSGNEINDYIEDIKLKIGEEDYSNFTDTKFYDDFVKVEYVKLKSKMDSFYKQNKAIIASSKKYSLLNENNEKSFNVSINFLENKFNNKTNIGLLASLEKIQFDVVYFQFLFMNTIIG